MFKIKSVHIEETRGIRSLEITPNKENFSISGPNGSGKSGVVDAIEFVLTGDIKRLAGSGTKGLSVLEHGPHVDKVGDPDTAIVRTNLHLTKLGKSVEITRCIKNPKKIVIKPNDPDILKAVTEIAAHPEITLSRRDIIRFILVGPTERSKEIQSLLKLNQLGETRSTLKTANNSLKRKLQSATSSKDSSRQQLQLHLQLEKLSKNNILDVVNKNRKILDLDELTELTKKTQLDKDLTTQRASSKLNKTSAVGTIEAMTNHIARMDEIGVQSTAEIVLSINKLQNDPQLIAMIQQKKLVEMGLDLVKDENCPLCDTVWSTEAELKSHLHGKLQKSLLADQISKELLDNASNLISDLTELTSHLDAVRNIAKEKEINAESDVVIFNAMDEDLKTLKSKLSTVDDILALKQRFENGWLTEHSKIKENIESVGKQVHAIPDQSTIVGAQTFITTAQLRLKDYRASKENLERAKNASGSGKIAYETYCEVMESELTELYEEVQNDFSTYYRALNENDEDSFKAKFTPSEGALALDVNFYERGLFPPGAYHSEGHQDGMGVCLYLALMKRLFEDDFTFALLDDVVMSVDSGHRYQFCKLLRNNFPNTQFILTTHDRLWAKQMNSAKLVTAKNSLVFHSWTVDSGPLVASNKDVWEDIDEELDKGNVETSAATLRRHLEYFSNHQCDQLGATLQFKADGSYDLGALLPAAQKRLKDLLGIAMSAAHSWGNDGDNEQAKSLKEALASAGAALQIDRWAINPAVHYNSWANFEKADFTPIVEACSTLVDCFECQTCESWLYVTPKLKPESLRCTCGEINFNLNKKPK